MGFKYYLWDPWLIISQIVAVQTSFYLVLGMTVAVVSTLLGGAVGLDQLVGERMIYRHASIAWSLVACHAVASICGAMTLFLIVGRAKQCLDFSVTAQVIHLLLSCLYTGFPTSWLWWVLSVTDAVIMTVLGETLCMRLDLSDIPLLSTSLGASSSSSSSSSSSAAPTASSTSPSTATS